MIYLSQGGIAVIKAAAYKNDDAAMKLGEALFDTEPHIFMERYGLSPLDCHTLVFCWKEYAINGIAKTFIKTVADVFKKFGFCVKLDAHQVNYLIS